jgi:hypothetical protein
MSFRRLVAPAVVLACISLTALPAYARGGHTTPTTPRASLTVSPNSVPAGGTAYMVSGCGYAAGKDVQVTVKEPGSLVFTSVGADATGCMRIKLWSGNTPGTYTVSTYQSAKAGGKLTLMAAASLSVV